MFFLPNGGEMGIVQNVVFYAYSHTNYAINFFFGSENLLLGRDERAQRG